MLALMIPLVGDPFFRKDLPGFLAGNKFWSEAREVDPTDRSLLHWMRRVDWRWTGTYARRTGDILFEMFEELP